MCVCVCVCVCRVGKGAEGCDVSSACMTPSDLSPRARRQWGQTTPRRQTRTTALVWWRQPLAMSKMPSRE